MEILIKSKTHGVQTCLIDDVDYHLIKEIPLHLKKSRKENTFYVRVSRKLGCIGLHRYLMGNPVGFQVDHKNNNPLDNRRENLRIATPAQNNFNRIFANNNKSGFKGVFWAVDKKCWRAVVQFNRRRFFGGYFDCKIDAAYRYNELALEHFGEFANLNVFTDEDNSKRLHQKLPPKGMSRNASSGYKGVYKMTDKCFVAHIRVNSKKKHIGCYKTIEQAAISYNKEAVKYFGKETFLNKIK